MKRICVCVFFFVILPLSNMNSFSISLFVLAGPNAYNSSLSIKWSFNGCSFFFVCVCLSVSFFEWSKEICHLFFEYVTDHINKSYTLKWKVTVLYGPFFNSLPLSISISLYRSNAVSHILLSPMFQLL